MLIGLLGVDLGDFIGRRVPIAVLVHRCIWQVINFHIREASCHSPFFSRMQGTLSYMRDPFPLVIKLLFAVGIMCRVIRDPIA